MFVLASFFFFISFALVTHIWSAFTLCVTSAYNLMFRLPQTARLQLKVLSYLQGVSLFLWSFAFFGTLLPVYLSDSYTQNFSVFIHFSLRGFLFRIRHTGLQCALFTLTWNSSLGTIECSCRRFHQYPTFCGLT